MTELEHSELTEQIIAAAIAVHKELGPGFLESVYENAMAIELSRQKINFSRQLKTTVLFQGVEVGRHILDLFVENTIVVELKSVTEFKDVHFATVRSYLRAVNRRHGLLLNFNATTLGIKRVLNSTSINR